MFRIALLAIGLMLGTSPAFGFGAAGHHAVCEIAYRTLTPDVRTKVDQILRADGDERFFGFGAACGWPDRHDLFGSILREYGADHFINVPRGSVDASACVGKDGPTDRCLLTTIPKMVRVLQGLEADKLGHRDLGYPKDKTEALRFLGHWLGDIHQPLHVSYGDDRGGNELPVYGVKGCSSADKKDLDRDGDTSEQVSSLHKVWDTCIVEDSMSERGFRTNTDDRTAYSEALFNEITVSQRALWSAVVWSTGPDSPIWAAEIANESYALAQSGPVQYCVATGGQCWYAPGVQVHKNDEPLRVLQLSEGYEDLHRTTVETRLKQAGVRLGTLLNRVLQ